MRRKLNIDETAIIFDRVLVCQLEISAETSLYALKMGGDNGAITILNPAPAVEKLNTGLNLLAFTIISRVPRDSNQAPFRCLLVGPSIHISQFFFQTFFRRPILRFLHF